MQGIKISSKHKINPYAFTKNSNEPKAKVNFIKYCKIVRNVIKEAKKRHYSRRIAKSNNKIKTTWNNIKKETGKVHSVEQVPTLL
jgi:ribosomal protein L33